MTLDEFLAEIYPQCHACPTCWDVPCPACQAGGVCDAICVCWPEEEERGSLDDLGDDE